MESKLPEGKISLPANFFRREFSFRRFFLGLVEGMASALPGRRICPMKT